MVSHIELPSALPRKPCCAQANFFPLIPSAFENRVQTSSMTYTILRGLGTSVHYSNVSAFRRSTRIHQATRQGAARQIYVVSLALSVRQCTAGPHQCPSRSLPRSIVGDHTRIRSCSAERGPRVGNAVFPAQLHMLTHHNQRAATV